MLVRMSDSLEDSQKPDNLTKVCDGDGDHDSSQTELFLSEIRQYEDLLVPIKLSPGVIFSAIAVSEDYIWCGSNRATLYVFDHKSLKHIYLIPTTTQVTSTTQSTITHLSVYKTQLLCASANRNGEIYVCGLKKASTKKPDSVEALKLKTEITQLVWHTDNTKLYVGDNTGSIHICSILTSKIFPKCSTLTKLDSHIQQLDFRDGYLLASTLTKCAIYDTEKKVWTDIGSKSRNGYYGAVLSRDSSSSGEREREGEDISVRCYCARPGLRVWRADTKGKVSATLNFKQSIADSYITYPLSRFSSKFSTDEEGASFTSGLPSGLPNLQRIREDYLISMIGRRIAVLDPRTSSVLMICQITSDLVSYSTYHNSLHVLTSDGQVLGFELTSLTEYIELLLEPVSISGAARACLGREAQIKHHGMLLHRVQELLPTDDELYKNFDDVFSSTIEDYKSSLSISGKNSRSSTVSSVVSRLQNSDQLSNPGQAGAEVINEPQTEYYPISRTDKQSLTSADDDNEHPSDQQSTDDIIDVRDNCAQSVNLIEPSPQQTQDAGMTIQINPSNLIKATETPELQSSHEHSIPRNDSSKSLVSITSSLATNSTRRGSITSMSSFDHSEDYTEDRKPRRRKLRAATITFTSPDKAAGAGLSDDEPTDYRTPPQPIFSAAGPNSSLPHSLSREFSPSPKSQGLSPSPRSLGKEISSPGDVVDHVRDHVKDGLTRIGSQAKSLISVIKEKAASQPAIEKLLGQHLHKDEMLEYGQSGTPAELSEDSGSHQGFFIGDGDDISMSDETPSSLSAYLELTESTYSRLSDPLVLINKEEVTPLLERWSQKLCLVLSQYSNSRHSSDGPASLRQITRVCPWRMSGELMRQSRYLCTLSVLTRCCECIQDYKMTSCDHTADSELYLMPWCYDCEGASLRGGGDFVETDSGLHSDHSSPLTLLTSYKQQYSEDSEESQHETAELTDSRVIERTDSCLSGVLQSTCRFMSTFWFLMDIDQLCTHIEQLSNTDTIRERALWGTLINCLVESCSEKLEWKTTFSGSIFSVSDMGRKLFEQNDKQGLWLYTYLLVRQQKLDKAVTVAIDSWMQVPAFHMMMCLKFTCEDSDDNGKFQQIDKHFCKYMQSLVQYQEQNKRVSYLKDKMRSSELLEFWLQCLDTSESQNSEELCTCGKPIFIQKIVQSSLQFLLHDILLLLEECFSDNEQVQSLTLKLGGGMAYLRQRLRVRDTEEIIRILLLSSDTSLITDTLTSPDQLQLNRGDWLKLLQLRAQQQSTSDNKMVQCLWCQENYHRSSPLLTWDSLADVMLVELGADECMDILAQAELPVKSVSAEFFSKCVKSHQQQIKSRQIVGDLIDSMESFLWSTELSDKNISPFLLSLAEQESSTYRNMKEGYHLNQSLTHQLTQKANALKQMDSLRTVENGDIHWGTTVTLNNECNQCGLMLSHQNQNITVFSCGHTVHQACCTSDRCLLC